MDLYLYCRTSQGFIGEIEQLKKNKKTNILV